MSLTDSVHNNLLVQACVHSTECIFPVTCVVHLRPLGTVEIVLSRIFCESFIECFPSLYANTYTEIKILLTFSSCSGTAKLRKMWFLAELNFDLFCIK